MVHLNDMPASGLPDTPLTRRIDRVDLRETLTSLIDERFQTNVKAHTKQIPTKAPKSKSKKSMLINLFDSHFGERIIRNSRIAYDFDLGDEAICSLFDRAFNEILVSGKDNYDEIIIVLGGDNIEGDGSIFDGQIFRLVSQASIWEQMARFMDCIFKNTVRAAEFIGDKGKVKIIGVAGNHGEQRSNSAAHPIASNYDTGTMKFLYNTIHKSREVGCSILNNVSMEFPLEERYFMTTIKDNKVLLTHRLPANLMNPGSRNKVHNLNYIFKNVDYILTGHLHDSALVSIGPMKVIRLGSAAGPNDYSDELGLYGMAEQTLLVLSKDKKLENIIPHYYGKTK